MFPLGSRRASRAPVHDHSRPIPPTSCRDARKLAPANPRPPRSLPPTPPPLVHQTESPSRPDRSHRKPRAKRPPPPKLAPARASHSAGSMQYPRRHKLTPPRAAILPALCDAVSPTTPTASARRTAHTHARTISRARRPRRVNHTPAIVRHRHAHRAPSTGAPRTVRRCMKSALRGKRYRSSAHGMFALRDSANDPPPSRPCVVLRCAVWARPLAKSGAPRAVAAARLARLARAASGYG